MQVRPVVMGMVLATISGVISACAARHAEPLVEPRGTSHATAAVPRSSTLPFVGGVRADLVASAPRPDSDVLRGLPDPHEELRWPLSLGTHPMLEPTYPIAATMAGAGVSWMNLCQRGAQHRHVAGGEELLHYLRGWCFVADHDVDAAFDELGPLLGSTTRNVAASVRHDLANILVDHGSSADAERLLAKHHIADGPVLDLLAATYVEVGRLDDAMEINDLTLRTDRGSEAMVCQRLTRKALLAGASQLPDLLAELGGHAARKEPRCMELDATMRCWALPSRATCRPFVAPAGTDPSLDEVLGLYFSWPAGPTPARDWWLLTYEAMKLLPTRGADALALTALETALGATPCAPDYAVFTARTYVGEIEQSTHDPALDPRLHELATNTRAHCRP